MEKIIKIYSKQLIKLAVNITQTEKLEAQINIPISKPTLDKYLKGRGNKIELSDKLLEFFLQKVNKRIEEIPRF